MSSILYYSNYCQNCKDLLQSISRSAIKDEIHFICLDNRVKRPNGATYVILSNNQEILLPPTITKVPALLLLNRGHHVLFGDDIKNHLEPKQIALNQSATINNGEPMAYSFNTCGAMNAGGSGFGVASDNYSFLDQNSDDLAAKGNGGMRQQHHYATPESEYMIETPPDNYSPDKVGTVSMEQLQQSRANDIKKN